MSPDQFIPVAVVFVALVIVIGVMAAAGDAFDDTDADGRE